MEVGGEERRKKIKTLQEGEKRRGKKEKEDQLSKECQHFPNFAAWLSNLGTDRLSYCYQMLSFDKLIGIHWQRHQVSVL